MTKIGDFPILLVIETQKVKSYLFASAYMRESRGASLLLDLLNRKRAKKLLEQIGNEGEDYHLMYLGGGSGRILFKNKEKAEDYESRLLALYERQAPGSRIATAVLGKGTYADGKGEPLVAWISRGVRQTQQQKLNRSVSNTPFLGRWIRPCSSCGVEPAAEFRDEHGQHFLCRSCNSKRDSVSNTIVPDPGKSHPALYRETKPGRWRTRELKDREYFSRHYGDDFIFTTLIDFAAESYPGHKLRLPQDFADIGSESRPSNYLGFIYADGNRMGEAIKTLGKDVADDAAAAQAYRAFSRLVDTATREAAVEAVLQEVVKPRLQTLLSRGNNKTILDIPAEFILAGGDDLMLAVPADCALPVAIRFMALYQQKTRELREHEDFKGIPENLAPQGLTTSAGVVIAHQQFPVSGLMELAGELMKLAKFRAATEPGLASGTLDFLVVSEAGTEPVKQRRKDEYFTAGNGPVPAVYRTERPYTEEEAKKLLGLIEALKGTGVPRNKLKALYPILFENTGQALIAAHDIKARLKKTGHLEKDPLKTWIETMDCFPFRTTGRADRPPGEWSTQLADIIELYDFVHPEPDATGWGKEGGDD